MSLFFTGSTVEECHVWVSALYEGIEFKDKVALIQAQVDAIMESKMQERPYPEFLPGSNTRVYLRDYPSYAFDIDLGVIFNVTTGLILSATKGNQVYLKGKMLLVHNEGLKACVPRPDHPNVSSDHRNHDRSDNRLENLRWGSASLQSTNRRFPKVFDMPAVEVKKDGGEWVFHTTRKAFAHSLGLKYEGTNQANMSIAIKNESKFLGYTIRNWTPARIGELRVIPASVVGGNEGYLATEFGGWIRKPNGSYTQGSKESGSNYYVIGIKKGLYSVHVLTTNAFHGLRPSERHQANHKAGVANGPADAKDLEWTTISENSQHAHDSGLSPGSRPVIATMNDGSTQSFKSAHEAVRWFKEKGVTLCSGHIGKACSGKVKTHGKMTWKYADGTVASKKRKFINDE